MVSGVGFKSAADQKRENSPRKKTLSRGLVVALVALIAIVAAWLILKKWQDSLVEKGLEIDTAIAKVNSDIQNDLRESGVIDFSVRAQEMEKQVYRGYETNVILKEIERAVVLKESDNSGNRVVLKSFEHNSGSTNMIGSGSESQKITGRGRVTVTADADTFDVMAQQIEIFKKSQYFDNITVGATDRDESGRIVFTLMMDVVDFEKTPYESNEEIGEVVESSGEQPVSGGGVAESGNSAATSLPAGAAE